MVKNVFWHKFSPLCNTFVSYWYIIIIVIVLLVFAGLKTINQGYVGVITMFGKYRRVIRPGLNLLIPFLEQISRRVRCAEPLRGNGVPGCYRFSRRQCIFQALHVALRSSNDDEETIKKVASSSSASATSWLTRTIEGTIRLCSHQAAGGDTGLRKEIQNM